jgi:hypothetical protein
LGQEGLDNPFPVIPQDVHSWTAGKAPLYLDKAAGAGILLEVYA